MKHFVGRNMNGEKCISSKSIYFNSTKCCAPVEWRDDFEPMELSKFSLKKERHDGKAIREEVCEP